MRYLIKDADGDDALRGETVHGWVSAMTPTQQRALQDYHYAWYDPETRELTGQILSWPEWAAAAGVDDSGAYAIEGLDGAPRPEYQDWMAGEDPTTWRVRRDLRAKAKTIPFPKAGELSAQDKQRLLDQLGDPSNPNRRRLVQLSSIGVVERAFVPPGMETEALHNYLIDRGRVEEYVEYVMNTWMTTTQPMTAPDPDVGKLFSVVEMSEPKFVGKMIERDLVMMKVDKSPSSLPVLKTCRFCSMWRTTTWDGMREVCIHPDAPKGLRAFVNSAPPLECPLRPNPVGDR